MPGTPATPNKLVGLEAVRFVAAFAVLIWHYQHFAYIADKPVDLVRDRLPLYNLLYPFYEAGVYGVWVFWCVSGFIFFWKYRDPIFERSMPGWRFFVFRLSRLYPLHAVTLVIVAVLQSIYFHQNGYFFVYQNNDVRHFVLQIFMASDWGLEHGNSFNGPIWSISVEVLAYLLFFLSLRFVTRSALFNVVVLLACVNMGGEFFDCVAFFYAGGLAAIARRAIVSAPFRGVAEGAGWLAAVIVPMLMWMFSSHIRVIDWAFFLICTPVLLFCVARDFALPPRVQGLLEAAGNMTYSSYLTHFPIQILIAVGFAMSGDRIPFYDVWFFVTFIVATLLTAYLTYRYFEAPLQTLLRNTLLQDARPAAPATGTAHGSRVSV